VKALVLGGKGAIGKAIVSRLADSGYEVTAAGRDDFDLTNDDEISSFFGDRRADFDVLVHSGGCNTPKIFESLTDDEIRHSLEANLFGFLRVARHCIPHLKINGKGRIVVISSLYGFLGRRGRLPYVMSKHALNGVVKTLAIELGPFGVLVNSVSPGYIATPLTYRNNSSEDIEKIVNSIPVGRLGAPADIARVVEFLCSAQNTYINGQDIVVDGGFSSGGFQ
jgi:3-oxoacyl-[acyl-carrier protein] reductase